MATELMMGSSFCPHTQSIAAANPAIPKSMIFRISIPPSNVFRGFSDNPEHFPFSTFI